MKWVKLNWRHQINQQNGRLRGPCSVCCYILDSFSLFSFLSLHSRLRQSLFLLMRTTQISKAVLSNMMLISRRLQSVLHRRRMNRARVWVYPRNQRWFGEIHRNPAMHDFFREQFRMNFDSFHVLCRILSPFMAKRNTRFRVALIRLLIRDH